MEQRFDQCAHNVWLERSWVFGPFQDHHHRLRQRFRRYVLNYLSYRVTDPLEDGALGGVRLHYENSPNWSSEERAVPPHVPRTNGAAEAGCLKLDVSCAIKHGAVQPREVMSGRGGSSRVQQFAAHRPQKGALLSGMRIILIPLALAVLVILALGVLATPPKASTAPDTSITRQG
jgi:hypothetical protein